MATEAAVPRDAPFVSWSAVIAGAIAAAALAFTLHSFAAALGLSVSSTAPTWRDSSTALVILSGLYLVLTALASYGLGGYVAGRVRERMTLPSADESEIRDGGHGLLVWALATIFTILLVLWSAQALAPLAAPSGSSAGPATSVGGENIVAYDVDRLLRSDRRTPAAVDLAYTRAEVSRILLTAGGHSGVSGEDRTYLNRLVGNLTGLEPANAERRVNEVVTQSAMNIRRARRTGVLLAFMAGAAALMGAAAAWFAACVGGRHRDLGRTPSMMWGIRGPRFDTDRVPRS